MSQLSKRYSHDEMLLLPQLGVSSSPCGLLDESLCGTSDSVSSHRHWRVPKVHTTSSTLTLDFVLCPFLASQTRSAFFRGHLRQRSVGLFVSPRFGKDTVVKHSALMHIITAWVSGLIVLFLKNDPQSLPVLFFSKPQITWKLLLLLARYIPTSTIFRFKRNKTSENFLLPFFAVGPEDQLYLLH